MGVQVPSSALDDTPRFCLQDFGVFFCTEKFREFTNIEEYYVHDVQNMVKWSDYDGGTDKTGFVKGGNIK